MYCIYRIIYNFFLSHNTTLVSRFPSEDVCKCHQSNHLAIDFSARPGLSTESRCQPKLTIGINAGNRGFVLSIHDGRSENPSLVRLIVRGSSSFVNYALRYRLSVVFAVEPRTHTASDYVLEESSVHFVISWN